MNELKNTWHQLVARYSSEEQLIEDLWLEIEKAHSSPKRHYHNLEHLQYMLKLALKFQQSIQDLDTLLFSIFYHDFVYQATKSDNEERSAEVATQRLQKLSLANSKIQNCQAQILATKSHENIGDKDCDFLLDFDLAILGDEPAVYESYCQKIRKEYSIYPNYLYRKGRKKVLEHFLAMEWIFKTAEFRDSHEKQARQNLKMELGRL
ncbi:HD domain-containing protein [Croceimicrobium hydrocarbonivorans]|uniref:Metal-dependent HD superfamily phosphohydrolase n=1 Tax=Croceimicrobium hydrocarbonivorans TaxID=2761580 RepID=A0A7H0VIC5_9FLAO|nr:hypothetical protein [Croceimicrobium hydrocarbonivorans]QNR25473.1 hypothetical protein H4K34_06430 [Croceimicrobium hydrocarbonivorans]